jgi:uncharacterized protein YndB with AHSA1/START domain
MPVKKNNSGRRWVEMEVLVPGTPEQVWQAIATGPGMAAWFTPATVDERVGGAIAFDFGDMGTQMATVTAWEPPHRLEYEERDWSGNTPVPGPLATEITVTGRSGDRCVIRMVHSLFTEKDDWDDELEGFESGWPGFFGVLRAYLAHFAGQPAAIMHAAASRHGDEADVWSALTSSLGLAGANAGERRVSPADAPRIAGVVQLVHQDSNSRHMMVRLDEPASGIALIGGYPLGAVARASVSIYFYGPNAADTAARQQENWTPWLRGVLEGERVAP